MLKHVRCIGGGERIAKQDISMTKNVEERKIVPIAKVSIEPVGLKASHPHKVFTPVSKSKVEAILLFVRCASCNSVSIVYL